MSARNVIPTNMAHHAVMIRALPNY